MNYAGNEGGLICGGFEFENERVDDGIGAQFDFASFGDGIGGGEAFDHGGDGLIGAEFSGGDLERVAYAACVVDKGRWNEADKKVMTTSGGESESVEGMGKPRIVDFTKDRGILAYANGSHPASKGVLWYHHRALYGLDKDYPLENADVAARTNPELIKP
jgi:hypothetical protein